MTTPSPPIELTGSASRWGDGPALPPGLSGQLAACAPVVTDEMCLAEASRDWWPLALQWSLDGEVPRRAGAVVRPRTTAEVAAIARLCHDHHVPLTTAGGRSGVCGASIPLHGGVVLDTTAMHGVLGVDDASLVVEVLPGTFGPDLENALRTDHGLTVGHWPQSMAISTVGGWVACRGAGQYSTRYGKIEDIVAGLEVVLADGRIIHTGGAPRAAAGPDLTQLFVGSEGTLGVITRVWLRAHRAPPAERRAAYRFPSFAAGLEACRVILRRGATPAVLRLYDEAESARGQGGDGTYAVMLVLDEGEPGLIDAVMAVVADTTANAGAQALGDDLVERWLGHRNDTSALQALTRQGFVVDTMEIAGRWSVLPAVFDAARAALLAIPHTKVASCHLSHSYSDGACLYFTFAALPPPDEREATYIALWDAGQQAIFAAGGNLSHHHGVGINRARFMPEALGPAFAVLQSVKDALDPHGILNPGKLGLSTPFGSTPWPV